MEKEPLLGGGLPAPNSQPSGPIRKSRFIPHIVIPIILILSILKWAAFGFVVSREPHGHYHTSSSPQCEQVDPRHPSSDNQRLENMYWYLSTDQFEKSAIKRLAGAVQIPTQSYDDMGPVGEDYRWDVMYEFAKYLKSTFPLVHKYLKSEVVNTHGLIYTYEGSDETLKPLLLLAHQDVVPVPNDTVSAWTHPPFSGHYDGKFIWGRGAMDCKNQLIAALETVETFLDAGFQPKRTIVLSFGFDEEINGRHGAATLAPYLLERYGKNGVAAIVDEGAMFARQWGSVIANPGTGEKGYTDVHITIRMPGGHSSIPVDHTSIGVLSELITQIEAEQYPTYVIDENPYLGQLQCGAEHSPNFPKKLKKLLDSHKPETSKAKPDYLALEAAKEGRHVQYLMQTSQAVDVITGGVKTNALPERATVQVNHRINIGDEPELVWDRLTSLAKPLAKKYGLKLHAFDGVEEEANSISLWTSPTVLRSAPVTPTNVDVNTPYRVLAGTTRALYGEDIIVSPGMTTGNTDTRYYWDLTKHTFRFGPGYDPNWNTTGLGNIHTVDEHVSVVNHVATVKWFTLFVRNMDEADLDD